MRPDWVKGIKCLIGATMVGGVAVHHDTLAHAHLLSLAQFSGSGFMRCQQGGCHVVSPSLRGKEVPAKIREGEGKCVRVGGQLCGREQRVETSVFKSAQQSVPGRSNFEIRALGPILFYFL